MIRPLGWKEDSKGVRVVTRTSHALVMALLPTRSRQVLRVFCSHWESSLRAKYTEGRGGGSRDTQDEAIPLVALAVPRVSVDDETRYSVFSQTRGVH